MTQAEKLEALVRKAKLMPSIPHNASDMTISQYCEYAVKSGVALSVIFNHDFVRALFEAFDGDNDPDGYYKLWEIELQNAVTSADPIDYLYQVAKQYLSHQNIEI